MGNDKKNIALSGEDLDHLMSLRPLDDGLMCFLFQDDLELAQFVLRIVMQNHTLILNESEEQRDRKIPKSARPIDLILYGADSTLNEMQSIRRMWDDGPSGRKRTRYYGSLTDAESLNERQELKGLATTYSVFFAEHDIFKGNAPVYPIGLMNMVTKEIYPCRQRILYVNGAYGGSDNIGMLMHDFRCSDPSGMYFTQLAKKTRLVKEVFGRLREAGKTTGEPNSVAERMGSTGDSIMEAYYLGESESASKGPDVGRISISASR